MTKALDRIDWETATRKRAQLLGVKTLLTFKQFCQKHPEWTEPGMRKIWYASSERLNSRGDKLPSNGFARAFRKIGGQVRINDVEFFTIIDEQNGF